MPPRCGPTPPIHAARGAVVHADLALGALTVALDADKQPDAIDFKLRADAGSLALVQPLLPRGAGWCGAVGQAVADADARDGRLEHLAAPSLRQHTELALAPVRFAGAVGSVAADRLELDASSNGDLAKHEAAVELRTRALRVGGAAQGDTTISGKLSYDGKRAGGAPAGGHRGRPGPSSPSMPRSASIARAAPSPTTSTPRRPRLATLAPLLHGGAAGFDFDTLAVALKGAGALTGLAADVDARGHVELVPDPWVRSPPTARSTSPSPASTGRAGIASWSCRMRHWHAVLATDGVRRLVHGTLTRRHPDARRRRPRDHPAAT